MGLWPPSSTSFFFSSISSQFFQICCLLIHIFFHFFFLLFLFTFFFFFFALSFLSFFSIFFHASYPLPSSFFFFLNPPEIVHPSRPCHITSNQQCHQPNLVSLDHWNRNRKRKGKAEVLIGDKPREENGRWYRRRVMTLCFFVSLFIHTYVDTR